MRALALPRLAGLVLLFFAVYAAMLWLGFRTGLLLEVERAITAGGLQLMALAETVPSERSVVIEREDGQVRYALVISTEGERQELSFRHAFHAQNLLLFLALALATPGLSLRQRALGVGIGVLLIYTLDVFIVAGDLIYKEYTDLKNPLSTASDSLGNLGILLRYLHPTGGAFMAPIFMWALVLVGPWRSDVMRALAPASAEPAEKK